MNERIVKLITEADAYAWTQCDKYVTECGEVNYLWEDAFRKKFAKLIVRECAKAADEGMAQVTMRVEWPSYHIKKHFGVEE